MTKYSITVVHDKTHVSVDVRTWASNEDDALTKAVESLANPLLRHMHTTVIGWDRP